MADGFNEARALRVAELMNDYRTLQLHISEQTTSVAMGDTRLEGYRVLAQNQAAAQRLLMAQFVQTPDYGHGGDLEMEKTQLRKVLLDASARRFHAHKLYLHVAAGKRWVLHRSRLGHSCNSSEDAARMREVDAMLRTDLVNITDQFIYADLREADLRAGHWVDEDPPLATILLWINSQP